MATSHDYREQANLFFRMALVSSDCEKAAQLEAQGRLYADLAERMKGQGTDHQGQFRKV